MAQSDRSHEGRLSALEQGFESMRGEIHGLRTDVRSFMAEQRAERRTQWSPIIAGVMAVLAILTAFASGPMGDIERLDHAVDVIMASRFTENDGEAMKAWVRELYDMGQVSAKMKDELQQREIDRIATGSQAQFDKMWERIHGVEDEDFKRPEAEEMRRSLIEMSVAMQARTDAELKWLREKCLATQVGLAAKGGS